jgi:hypothetical protein
MMVILVSAALVSFLLCLAAGRYAGWYGVVVPIALVVPFGAGEPDAIPFIVVSGLVAGLGFFRPSSPTLAPGRHRRSTPPLEDGLLAREPLVGRDRISGRPQSVRRRN